MKVASFKLKVESRTNLYYGKYRYRASLYASGIHYLKNHDTLASFLERVSVIYRGTKSPMFLPTGKLHEDSVRLVEVLLSFIQEFVANNKGCTRKEGNQLSFFSNDLDYLTQLGNIPGARVNITTVEASPDGIKYFHREPPAKYRVYLVGKQVPLEYDRELINYLERTPDVRPNAPLERHLAGSTMYTRKYNYMSSTYYLDYDDDKNLMMLHLLFPGAIGKSFKLEKRPR